MTDQSLVPERLETADLDTAYKVLKEKYPDAVRDDTRTGYSGVIVDKNRLVDVAKTIRDELGFNYLSHATAVDYLGLGDHLEMVYYAYRISGGPGLVFKTQTDREKAEVPSLVSIWPGADFQEREAYDLYGIRFSGHPNLKRILLW